MVQEIVDALVTTCLLLSSTSTCIVGSRPSLK